MFRLNWKEHYSVLHLTNEIGRYYIGGMGTYINEIYRHKSTGMGFLHLYDRGQYPDLDSDGYPGAEDIAALEWEEAWKLTQVNAELLVVHFYGLASAVTEEVLRTKRLIYVVHSVPLPEPPPKEDPFGGHWEVKRDFEYLCKNAEAIVCVSHAEKDRLSRLYPEYTDKINVIHNGLSLGVVGDSSLEPVLETVSKKRKVFGYLGRMDYRKGILECLKELRSCDAELHLACPDNDPGYLKQLLDYAEAGAFLNRVVFHGWCGGKRKEEFLRSLDALIVPSLYEPFGYVILEVMQYGVFVLTSTNGGLGEIAGEYKYQYNPYEKGALSRLIQRFQEDSNEELQRQQEILNERLALFSAEKMTEKYQHLWDRLRKEGEKFI